VSANLRVERCSNVTPCAASSARSRWLTADGVSSSRRAAALSEPCSTMAAKTASACSSSNQKFGFKDIVGAGAGRGGVGQPA
jgi:hypothetical protein